MTGNTHSFPSRERNDLTAGRNPSAVDGTTINFSPFSWTVKPLGHNARNQARKALVSPTPEKKMGVLLERSSAVVLVVAALALQMVPAGMPLRGPDMCNMRLVAVSVETADSDGFESMAECLSVPLG
jgi:hypothetical protein